MLTGGACGVRLLALSVHGKPVQVLPCLDTRWSLQMRGQSPVEAQQLHDSQYSARRAGVHCDMTIGAELPRRRTRAAAGWGKGSGVSGRDVRLHIFHPKQHGWDQPCFFIVAISPRFLFKDVDRGLDIDNNRLAMCCWAVGNKHPPPYF